MSLKNRSIAYWYWVLLFSGILMIFSLPVYLLIYPTQTKIVEREDIKEPFAMHDNSPEARILTGTVYRIDSSNTELFMAGMEMVEVKLDKENEIPIQFAAYPAPIAKFHIGDKAALKSIYFRRDELANPEMIRVLIKR